METFIIEVVNKPALPQNVFTRISNFIKIRSDLNLETSNILDDQIIREISYEIKISSNNDSLKEGSYILWGTKSLLPTFKHYLESEIEIFIENNKVYLVNLETIISSTFTGISQVELVVGNRFKIAGNLSEEEKKLFNKIRIELNVAKLPSLTNIIFDALKKEIESFTDFQKNPLLLFFYGFILYNDRNYSNAEAKCIFAKFEYDFPEHPLNELSTKIHKHLEISHKSVIKSEINCYVFWGAKRGIYTSEQNALNSIKNSIDTVSTQSKSYNIQEYLPEDDISSFWNKINNINTKDNSYFVFCGHGSDLEPTIKFTPDVFDSSKNYNVSLEKLNNKLKSNSNIWNSIIITACASNDFNPIIETSAISYIKHNSSLKFIQQSVFLNYFFEELKYTNDIESIFNLGKLVTYMIHEGALNLDLLK